mmetsp:Transcript_168758/g.324533  ORF Transcript_168758/g.324533 Transcript_168758/m.324533 type:complete len:565 (-) Transcript_168758:107-1801(-)
MSLLADHESVANFVDANENHASSLELLLWTLIIAAGLAALLLGAGFSEDSQRVTATPLRSERRLIRHLRLPRRAVVQTVQDGSQNGHRTEKPWPPKAVPQEVSVCLRVSRNLNNLVHAPKHFLMGLFGKSGIPWDGLRLRTDERIAKHRPLLVFVNSKSGGGRGAQVLEDLRLLLHYVQVIDFRLEGLEPTLRWWSKTSLRYRVLVCGGDGTVGAVLGCLEKLQVEYVPPVAIMPLGTGNDLSRVIRWGGGFSGSQIAPILQRVGEADAAMLDRWAVVCRDAMPEGRPAALPSPTQMERKSLVMCNYFGIGVDAAVALDFHRMRERSPHLFASRFMNKLLYLRTSVSNIFQSKRSFQDLRSKVVLECDGREVELPRNLEGIIVLNIGSFAGGCDLWGSADDDEYHDEEDSASSGSDNSNSTGASEGVESSRSLWKRPSMHDQLLEVVGVHGLLQLGAAQVGLSSATRLAQARHVLIRNKVALPVQVDGEPWMFARGGEVEISWQSQAIMLAQNGPGKSATATATDLVDWALQQEVINMDQRTKLMKEIARRAQRKSSVSLAAMG